ncbi:MAG: hypothetical protein D3916_05700 [Candidatus Electrothrix sp. MAN1_4]|nr:hypothetical protein [Candidatus Electrothrix sp. MAN1_4]
MNQPIRKIALFDWDETLRRGITLLPWSIFLYENNQLSREALEKIKACFTAFENHQLSYEEFAVKVVQEYGMGLKDNSAQMLCELAEKFVRVDKANLSSFTAPLINLLSSNNFLVVVVSGCPDTVLNAYSKILKIDVVFGLSIYKNDENFTGQVKLNPSLQDVKREVVKKIRGAHEVIVAAGNSNSDLPLFEHSKLSVAIKTDNHSLSNEVLRYAHLLNENDVLPFIEKRLLKSVQQC